MLACGPEEAPPVLLLHGSQANSAAWLPDIALWSSQFRFYAVDMIGEPRFSDPSRPDLGTDAHASWLDDVVAGLGLRTIGVVGTSLGEWLALDYAKRRPGPVRALALICPAGIGRQKNLLLKMAPFLVLRERGRRRIWEMVFGPPPARLSPELQRIGRLMDGIARAVRPRIVTILTLTDAERGSLRMPILAIVGDRDDLLDSGETRMRLEKYAPRAEVCFIEEGRHFLPDQMARVSVFLDWQLGRTEPPHGAAKEA